MQYNTYIYKRKNILCVACTQFNVTNVLILSVLYFINENNVTQPYIDN